MTKKQTELSEELREAVFEAARAGAAEAYTQNTGYVNYFKAMETLLYNYKKLAALVADEEAYCEVEYHAGRKTFSTTPQAKGFIQRKTEAEIVEEMREEKQKQFKETKSGFDSLTRAISLFEGHKEFVVIRLYYFGEDINGNPREGGTATWEEIAEELSDAGILKEIKTARRWRNKIVNDMGCFGAPMSAANKKRYTSNHTYNKQAARTRMINAASADTFGFDCVCLIKGILWGWRGDTAKSYGGASYAVNGVPDIGADQMITKCAGVSTDFSNVAVGEALWCEGHIGVYIGNGLGVECTPRWDNKVQITAVANIGKKAGYNARTWRKHGKLPYIDYTGAQTDTSGGTAEGKKDNAVAGYAVGDIVEFIGTKHYTSANASSGKPCKAGKAKITQIYKSGKHQYHLVKVSGGGSTVYGWVDAQDISGRTSAQKIMAGSKVRVKAGAKTYSGGSLASFVYSRDHIVKELSGKRAVITYGGTVVAAVNVDDLTLI